MAADLTREAVDILGTIHVGCSSTVYRVEIGGRIYIAKTYKRARAEELRNERSMLSAAVHDNIVASVPLSLRNTIVLEYHGCDLRRFLEQGPPHRPGAILRQILQGLEYLHGRSIVHCDIKPENLLIDGAGRVKIADFGSARCAGAESHGVRSTTCYSALEVLLGVTTVETSADMWATGCVFYELLLGTQPFTGENTFSVINQILGVLGSPVEDDYRGLDIRHITFINVFTGAPPRGQGDLALHPSSALLLSLLAFDPRKRATAAHALRCLDEPRIID